MAPAAIVKVIDGAERNLARLRLRLEDGSRDKLTLQFLEDRFDHRGIVAFIPTVII